MPRHSSKSHAFSSFLGSINSACSQPKSRGADQGPKGPCCCWNIWPPRGSAHFCSHVPSPIDVDTDELTSTRCPSPEEGNWCHSISLPSSLVSLLLAVCPVSLLLSVSLLLCLMHMLTGIHSLGHCYHHFSNFLQLSNSLYQKDR